jgi:glucose/arabinose dehydrogenase
MTRTSLIATVPLVGLIALGACIKDPPPPSTQYGANPLLPAPTQFVGLPTMEVPKAVGWRPGQTPVVPAGLKIQPLATGFEHPRQVYTLPNGDILVVESNGPAAPIYRPKDYWENQAQFRAGAGAAGGNRITLLRDANGDGRPELRTIFLDHLNAPFGVRLVGNTLYVADTDALLQFHYTPGQTRIAERGKVLTSLPGGPIDHHWTKSLAASPDGTKLFVGVGSNSNITENGIGAELDRAAIWEVDRATGYKRLYASGMRNPTGLQIDPQSHKLFAVVNERDEIGPDLVPDYLTSVAPGAFYGWPWSYYGQHVDVRVQPQRPDMVAKAIRPDYALSSHVAPLGLLFTEGSSLPPAIRNGALVAEHGSWDRVPLNGYKVAYIAFRNGHPVGVPHTLVSGFLAPDQKTVRGRPVGMALDKTGALLIADDTGNTVWRVSAAPVSRAA